MGRQQALQTQKRADRFNRICRMSEGFESMMVNELSKQDVVLASFQEISKQEPATKINDIVLGGVTGNSGSSGSPGYFWGSRVTGNLNVRYTYVFRKLAGTNEPLIDVTISSSFDSNDAGLPVMQFSFPTSESNEAIAKLIAEQLSKQFEYEADFRRFATKD